MLAVEVVQLSCAYGDRLVLKKVSFAVGEGDLFGIVGLNGSGKSTLLRVLATLLVPLEGTARVCRYDILRQAEQVRRHVGVVFQTSSLDGKLTLEENLRHYGQLYGLYGRKLAERVEGVLRRTDLYERRNEVVERLSGGLRRRGDVARSLLHEPDVLLLDEPTTGFDPVARHEFWRYLDELRAERPLTVLLATHLMNEAERCHQLALLHHGEIVALASPEELRREMGYDVLTIQTVQPHELARKIREHFQIESCVGENLVRMEVREGHQLVGRLVETFPDLVESVRLNKPSIEDVFVFRTGTLAPQERGPDR